MRWLRRHGRCSDERGVTLILFTLMLTSILLMAAIVLDLGQVRASRRLEQSVADFAALASARELAHSNPTGACRDAITYINANLKGLPSTINASTFCGTAAQTTCSGGNLTQATPSTTAGSYTVSLHYPVPASEIQDAKVSGGAYVNDGAACQRLRVIITVVDRPLFGVLAGTSTLSSTRSATVRPSDANTMGTPVVWLLDPTGCTSMSVGGGAQVTIGDTANAGFINVDSDGSTCGSNQDTITASGTGTRIQAIPTSGSPQGAIKLFALPVGATTCSDPACNSADVTGGRLVPQPINEPFRATRARVDWRYNCKTRYPTFHGLTIANCPNTTPAYIDLMKAAIGTSGAPDATFQRWTATGHSCSPTGVIAVTGNWWVDCQSGLNVGNGTSVTFLSGNVVLDGGIKMTGSGVLSFNTANPAANLPSSCLPPAVSTPCIDNSSAAASLVYLRSGDIAVTGGLLTINHATVSEASGIVKINSSPPTWLASTEGPFAQLALWAEAASSAFQIAGGAGVSLSGIFFTPEAAPFGLTGGGDWGQQHAQFIAYQLAISGNATLNMSPDPANFLQLPQQGGTLIR